MFDPARARTKQAVPVWADALLRDTMHLSPEEFGVWHLLIYAMWARPSLDLPDDDRFLARVSRMTLRSWRNKMRHTMLPLFLVADGVWRNRRLAKEAQRVERFLSRQSWRRAIQEEESRQMAPANDEFRVALLGACGSRADLGHGFASEPQMIEARRWVSDLGLSPEDITSEIRSVMARSGGERIQSLRYFTPAMERLAGQVAESSSRELSPRSGGRNGRGSDAESIGAAADRIARNSRS